MGLGGFVKGAESVADRDRERGESDGRRLGDG